MRSDWLRIGGLMLVLMFVSTACGQPPTRSDTPVPVKDFDPANYFQDINGDASLAGMPIDSPDMPKTAKDWEALLHQERQVGLEGMPRDERSALLSVSIKWFLSHVRDADWLVTIPGSAKSATIVEEYVVGPTSSGGRIYSDVKARSVMASGIDAHFGGVPNLSSAAPSRTIAFNRFYEATVSTDYWTFDENGHWSCSTSDDTADYTLVALARMGILEGVSTGAFHRDDGALYAVPSGGTGSVEVEIDGQSLLPVGFRYVNQAGNELARVHASSFNQSAPIVSPSDSQICGEAR